VTSGPVTSGPVRDAAPPGVTRAQVGRPPWWAMVLALLIGVAVTADLLASGATESFDVRVSDVVKGWGLADSSVYPAVWLVTQVGGRVTILTVLLGLCGYLAWTRRTLLPFARVLVSVVLLTGAVYAVKYGTGRTAPGYPGSYFFHHDGASFPSGHVANAVLMWGVARWQAVEYGLPLRVQRIFWWLAVVGPVVTGLSMISLDFHWVTDAVVGAAVGVLLLGVVHALDAFVLSRWARARAGRHPA
jgi:membrane-associated phospholipid phosphatase